MDLVTTDHMTTDLWINHVMRHVLGVHNLIMWYQRYGKMIKENIDYTYNKDELIKAYHITPYKQREDICMYVI